MDEKSKEIRKRIRSSKWGQAFAAASEEEKKVIEAKKKEPKPKAEKKAKGWKGVKAPAKAQAEPKSQPLVAEKPDRSSRSNYGKAAGVMAATQLQDAFDFFNRKLFDGKLPACLVRYQVEKKANGIFSPDRFAWKRGQERLDEICINPTIVDGRTDRDILSTLVHEMVHLEQEAFGKPPRRPYHNEQWCDMMRSVGLEPVIVDKKGNPTGKEKGKLASHTIEEGGYFDEACQELLETGFTLEWLRLPDPVKEKKPSKPKPKTHCDHVCPSCDETAKAKIEAKLTCGKCDMVMIPEINPEDVEKPEGEDE